MLFLLEYHFKLGMGHAEKNPLRKEIERELVLRSEYGDKKKFEWLKRHFRT